jgi:hypothetical protein
MGDQKLVRYSNLALLQRDRKRSRQFRLCDSSESLKKTDFLFVRAERSCRRAKLRTFHPGLNLRAHCGGCDVIHAREFFQERRIAKLHNFSFRHTIVSSDLMRRPAAFNTEV